MYKKIKKHVKNHKEAYIVGGLVFAGITCFIMGRKFSQPISVTVGDAANCTVGVIGKKVSENSVSVISANRQGSPSWVVRCLETDQVFTSQNKAAIAMNIPKNHLSNHLNGDMENVRGYTFERICMAA